MNSDEVIEASEAQLYRETEDRVRAIAAARAQRELRLVENLGVCIECDSVPVEKERVAANCVTCLECAMEGERVQRVRAKQYAR